MTPQNIAERRAQWSFVITDEGWQWQVRKPDGREERSRGAYTSLKDAAEDAARHGFASWKHEERRRIVDHEEEDHV